jgi:hypothetical protein
MEQQALQQTDLFKPGPLYNRRFEIVKTIKRDMRSGDILYRYSDARGPLGLPFTRIVANVTKSEYSHSAMLFVENGEPHVLEINDEGTLRYRLIDWIDTCYGDHFSIYRLKDLDDQKESALLTQIYRILEEDPDYDFTFSNPDKFYCTESVIEVYRRALGIEIDSGYLIKEVVPTWLYFVLRVGVFLFSYFGTSLPFDKKVYFVGNENRGMMSSPLTKLVIKI